MQSQMRQIVFRLLHYEISGVELIQATKNLITSEDFSVLYKLSKAHDLAHLVADALDKNGLLDDSDISKKFRAERNLAIYRYEQMQYELDEISEVLEQEKIDFIPLKGSVIRKYYPEPWMRTSCDIDILVNETSLETVIKLLCQNLGYTKVERGTHDVSLYSPSDVHVELHFNLLEDSMANNASKILNSVWNRLENSDESSQKLMQDDMFYYYHIAHMAKHIEFGGCGIKPYVVDLAKMPHLMVAGTTGSGKSVGVNSMILSLLYKFTPQKLRFIMIDPKSVEFAYYEDIPHLLCPVVTDMREAYQGLQWCGRYR